MQRAAPRDHVFGSTSLNGASNQSPPVAKRLQEYGSSLHIMHLKLLTHISEFFCRENFTHPLYMRMKIDIITSRSSNQDAFD